MYRQEKKILGIIVVCALLVAVGVKIGRSAERNRPHLPADYEFKELPKGDFQCRWVPEGSHLQIVQGPSADRP